MRYCCVQTDGVKHRQNHFANEMRETCTFKGRVETGVLSKGEYKHGKKCILMEVKISIFLVRIG